MLHTVDRIGAARRDVFVLPSASVSTRRGPGLGWWLGRFLPGGGSSPRSPLLPDCVPALSSFWTASCSAVLSVFPPGGASPQVGFRYAIAPSQGGGGPSPHDASMAPPTTTAVVVSTTRNATRCASHLPRIQDRNASATHGGAADSSEIMRTNHRRATLSAHGQGSSTEVGPDIDVCAHNDASRPARRKRLGGHRSVPGAVDDPDRLRLVPMLSSTHCPSLMLLWDCLTSVFLARHADWVGGEGLVELTDTLPGVSPREMSSGEDDRRM